MSYLEKINESNRKVHNQSVAQRILNLISELRLSSRENDSRRWIWELLQNAKDVVYENQPVSVDINFQPKAIEPFIEFKHNGKPFSIDNITFLIEQVSTKDRAQIKGKKSKITGKFGTGFLTTHLLSEKVELESVVKEPDLPIKKFDLFLDRSGREIDEIIDSVDNSFKLLSSLDEKETLSNFEQKQFNTTFRYLLDNDGIKTAKKGLEDMEITLPFTLAFVPSIQSVRVNSDTEYHLLPASICLLDNIEIFTIQKKYKGEIEEFFIAMISNERVSIAVQVEYKPDKITLIKPDDKLPRLFCDFPLIGSEDFNFPMIINSSYFNPKVERDGVYLSDKSDPAIVENKMLISEAKNLYLKFLEFTAQNNWNKMFVLADISLPKAKEWISKEWMKESFLIPIRKSLLTMPIIDSTVFGRIPIECGSYSQHLHPQARVDFPKHDKKEILEKLYQLCNNQYFLLPIESDNKHWAEIIWDNIYIVDLMNIVELIESKINLTTLSEKLGKSIQKTINWLNDFYDLLLEEGVLIKDISQSKIYPNQNGIFKKREELNVDIDKIPEVLKDIVKDLGDDFREKLIYKSINIELPQNSFYYSSTIAVQIAKLIKPRFAEISRSEGTRKIFKQLYLWFSQNRKEAENIFDNLYKNKHKLLDDNEIVTSIEKADVLDELLSVDPSLSLERIQKLLEIEELSKGFSVEKKYNPDEKQKRINFENGWKGEAFVYKTLIEQEIDVNWPNKSTIETANKIIDYKGETHYIADKGDKYDLVISLPDNKKSFVQVKSTSTDISRANEIAMPISVREWKFINEKSVEDSYYLARVFNVNTTPEVYFMQIENKI